MTFSVCYEHGERYRTVEIEAEGVEEAMERFRAMHPYVRICAFGKVRHV